MDEAVQVATQEPQFVLEWEHERPSVPVSLSALTEVNSENEGLCAWAREAVLGAEYRVGGGAAPLCIVRRVS